MANGRRRSIFWRGTFKIGVPVAITVLLYTATIYFLLIPSYEDSVMNRKKESVRHLTEAAWSVLSHLESQCDDKIGSCEAEKRRAIALFRDLRFGAEGKDYFWINDMHPHVVMHPYRPKLEGADVSKLEDIRDKRMFTEFARIAREQGEGWVEYHWQWKDDPSHEVPKISYVKRFAPWDWIIGTGLYTEDVKAEIAETRRTLTWLSLGILSIIALLSVFIFVQGLRAEQDRREAAEALRQLNEELENRVTQRTRELDEAILELESFNHTVSHDLRGPVHGILGYASLLQEDYARALDRKSNDYVTHIFTAARRMTEMIDGLLQLSRLSRTPIEREAVDLSSMALEVFAELRVQDGERDVDMVVQKDLVATGHDALLRTVFENLLGNAWKYTRREKRARIEFGSLRKDGETVFFVRDNGVGFDMKRSDNLFRPFRRLHTDDEFEGSGIGLATVQRVVQRHEGRVWAESQAGEGSTFFFTLS